MCYIINMENKKKTNNKEYLKMWLLKHPDYMKEWMNKHPEYYREWREKHPEQKEKQAKYYREWYKKNGRKRNQNYCLIILNWREKHPEALEAMKIVKNAIKDGLLKKPRKCSCCKRNDTRINAHHEDYNKPLTVIWLCSSCHKKLHLASDSS